MKSEKQCGCVWLCVAVCVCFETHRHRQTQTHKHTDTHRYTQTHTEGFATPPTNHRFFFPLSFSFPSSPPPTSSFPLQPHARVQGKRQMV